MYLKFISQLLEFISYLGYGSIFFLKIPPLIAYNFSLKRHKQNPNQTKPHNVLLNIM